MIPPSLLVRDVTYRTLGSVWSMGLGCGSLPKPEEHGRQTRFKYDESYCAIYVLRGTGLYRDETERECAMRAGDVIHRIPGLDHETIPTPDGEWVEFFMLMPRGYRDALCMLGVMDENTVRWSPGVDARLMAMCVEIRERMRSPVVAEQLKAINRMQDFLVEAYRLECRSRSDDPLSDAIQLLASDLDEPFGGPEVSDRLHLGYESFRKRFAERYGISPGAYRRRCRMDRAGELLASTLLPVYEIGATVGYADVYAFSKEFKKATGRSPRQFRKESR